MPDTDPSTGNEEGWEDVSSDKEDHTFKSLFSDQSFSDITAMLLHDKAQHGFDYVRIKRQLHLDSLDRVQLINYVRSSVAAGRALPQQWTTTLFEDEIYLQPHLPDDAVLYSLDDIDESRFDTDIPPDSHEQEVQDLRERLAQLQLQFSAYREEVNIEFQQRMDSLNDDDDDDNNNNNNSNDNAPSSSQPSHPPPPSQSAQDTTYFSSYSTPHIHSTMLSDHPRTSTYQTFISTHAHLFAGKTILDVGCGTGILSLFCARAGARLVLAVDNSSIIDQARVIVHANGYQDTIKCLRGRIEDVVLPVERVDVIVSEWMGYGLLYESMLDSVLWARDRYLERESGLMVPSHTTLRIAPVVPGSEVRGECLGFWEDVYGFDMSCMLGSVLEEAVVRDLAAGDVGPESWPVLELDLHTARVSDLTFLRPFTLAFPADGVVAGRSGPIDGFAVWFDVFFVTERGRAPATLQGAKESGVEAFGTGPDAPRTHWQQVALLIDGREEEKQEEGKEEEQEEVGKHGGEGAKVAEHAGGEGRRVVMEGMIGYQRKEGRGRSVDIEVIWKQVVDGRGGGEEGSGPEEKKDKRRQVWTLD